MSSPPPVPSRPSRGATGILDLTSASPLLTRHGAGGAGNVAAASSASSPFTPLYRHSAAAAGATPAPAPIAAYPFASPSSPPPPPSHASAASTLGRLSALLANSQSASAQSLVRSPLSQSQATSPPPPAARAHVSGAPRSAYELVLAQKHGGTNQSLISPSRPTAAAVSTPTLHRFPTTPAQPVLQTPPHPHVSKQRLPQLVSYDSEDDDEDGVPASDSDSEGESVLAKAAGNGAGARSSDASPASATWRLAGGRAAAMPKAQFGAKPTLHSPPPKGTRSLTASTSANGKSAVGARGEEKESTPSAVAAKGNAGAALDAVLQRSATLAVSPAGERRKLGSSALPLEVSSSSEEEEGESESARAPAAFTVQPIRDPFTPASTAAAVRARSLSPVEAKRSTSPAAGRPAPPPPVAPYPFPSSASSPSPPASSPLSPFSPLSPNDAVSPASPIHVRDAQGSELAREPTPIASPGAVQRSVRNSDILADTWADASSSSTAAAAKQPPAPSTGSAPSATNAQSSPPLGPSTPRKAMLTPRGSPLVSPSSPPTSPFASPSPDRSPSSGPGRPPLLRVGSGGGMSLDGSSGGPHRRTPSGDARRTSFMPPLPPGSAPHWLSAPGLDRRPTLQAQSSIGGGADRRVSFMPPGSPSAGPAPSPNSAPQPLASRLASSIVHQLDQLLLAPVPAEALQTLESLRQSMLGVASLISASVGEATENGNDVEVLCGILRTQHGFDERAVDAYRAASTLFPHHTFDCWHLPQYMSETPLPQGISAVSVIIRMHESFPPLPSAGAGAGGASASASVAGGKGGSDSVAAVLVEVQAGLDDTVDLVLRRAYAAYNARGGVSPIDPSAEPAAGSLASRLLLKPVGTREYLLPERSLLGYEVVRHALRNAQTIELAMVEWPKPLAPPPHSDDSQSMAEWNELREWRAQYEAKVKRHLRPLDEHTYVDSSVSFQSRLLSSAGIPRGPHAPGLAYIPASELVGQPFRVRVLGAERVGARTLPRLASSVAFGSMATPTSDSVDLFVRVYLAHGCTLLNHGPSSQTVPLRFDASAPRWPAQWITPPPANLHAQGMPYARLPRATKLLFLLYAVPASGSSSAAAAAAAAASDHAREKDGGVEDELALALAKNTGPLSARSFAAKQAKEAAAAQAAIDRAVAHEKAQAAANAASDSGSTGGGSSSALLAARQPRVPERSRHEVLLGWSQLQLVDEFGLLRSGTVELNLWTGFCGLHEREYNFGAHSVKRGEELTQILRSTNRSAPMPVPNGFGLTGEKEWKPPAAPSGHAPPPALVAGQTPFATLVVQFESFARPVVAPLVRRSAPCAQGSTAKALALNMHPKALDKLDRRQLAALLRADPLYDLTATDRELLWLTRSHLVYHPHMLAKFLRCVDWANPPLVAEAHRLLRVWSPPVSAVSALELLDATFADASVREYAVEVLDSRLSDADLSLYLLQLVQCLKFEPYHCSPLSRFLLRRALRAPYVVGHHLFWHLKAELGVLEFQERYTLLLEEYLSYAGLHARQLRRQQALVTRLQRIAELVVKLKVDERMPDVEIVKEYHARLAQLNREFFSPSRGSDGDAPQTCQIPLNPKLEAKGLIVAKCRYMSSKKVPLWLVFENADPLATQPIYVIFKSGDDLRQDILTLQLLRAMDQMWLDAGLDCRLKPYRCIATGVNDANEGVGMIEVVTGSDTTSGIQLKYGGGALGALKLDPLDSFIRAHNPQDAAYARAVDNFIRSCAGYCVATFVLGIGDRHNGNIMLTKDGHLFHIDFGHFLGNFKTKFGFKRERSAFVFTPEMAFVMGGKNYKKSPLFKLFKECCFKAFNVLRKHAATLENLFLLMCSAGMPELMDRSDVLYLRDMLCLDYSNKQAEKRFKAELKNSLDGMWRRIDNLIHNARHG